MGEAVTFAASSHFNSTCFKGAKNESKLLAVRDG